MAHHRKFPSIWWTRHRGWMIFILRELTCVFVAAYTVIMLILLCKLRQGEVPYRDFLEVIQGPYMRIFHVIGLLFVCFHSVTWFIATPKAVVVRLGEEKVPDHMMIGGNIGAWLFLTAAVVFFLR